MSSLYELHVKEATGNVIPMTEYEGKVLLIVNTASKCGFTPQFTELQELYDRYKDQGFAVLGFPCSQFHDQEYDDIEQTLEHCQLNYGVTFPMFAKIDVNGPHAAPLYRYLTESKKGMFGSDIKWNFTKFLLNRKGEVVSRYAPQTKPSKIAGDIEELL